MSINSKRCWDIKTSNTFDKKSYYVNTESGVSKWGKQDRKDPLPAGWEYCTSKKGDGFYYNHHLELAQWEKPTDSQKLPVPEGFEEKRSRKCQNVYYLNLKTGETQWEYPEEKETRGDNDSHFDVSEDGKFYKMKKSSAENSESELDSHDPYLNPELDNRTIRELKKQRKRSKNVRRKTPSDEDENDFDEYWSRIIDTQTEKPKDFIEPPIDFFRHDSEDSLTDQSTEQEDLQQDEDLYKEMQKDLDDERRNFQEDLQDKDRLRFGADKKVLDKEIKGKAIQKRTSRNHKKEIHLRDKIKKLYRLISLMNEERDKDTEEYKELRNMIQETTEEISRLKKQSQELDSEDDGFIASYLENEKLDRQTDQEEDSDINYESAYPNEEPRYRLLVKQLLDEGGQNPIVDSYREIKPVDKDERSFGLPYPKQYNQSLSRESLAKHRNQENRRHSQRYENYPIPLSPNDDVDAEFQDTPLSHSESDEEPENFYDAPMFNFNQSKTIANDDDEDEDDDEDFKDLDDFITPEKITEQNRTFGEFSHYKDQSDSKIPHRPTLSKRNQTQHRNNVNRLNLHPYR